MPNVCLPNGISMEYETFGDPKDEAVFLVQGLGGQMIQWYEDFVQLFVRQKYFVVRFDNRDIGKTTHLRENKPSRGMCRILCRYICCCLWPTKCCGGRQACCLAPAYDLYDMADDVSYLMDHLNIASVHLVGGSLGGMITQVFAIKYPHRCLSINLLMTTCGQLKPWPSKKVMSIFVQKPKKQDTLEMAINNSVDLEKLVNEGQYLVLNDKEAEDRRLYQKHLEIIKRVDDMPEERDGKARQQQAVLSTHKRTKQHFQEILKRGVPVLILHGRNDPLFPIQHGRSLHSMFPGSTFIELENCGHGLHPIRFEEVSQALIQNFKRNVGNKKGSTHGPTTKSVDQETLTKPLLD